MFPLGPTSGRPHAVRLGRRFRASGLLALACVLAACPVTARGQLPPVHYFHAASLPPGTVANGQLLRSELLRGYVQPVEIQAPEGVRISLNVGGQFDEPRPGPVRAGLLVGPVYQLKVSHIPFREGYEVFPTIEVVNRLYPPPGQAACFPVPVQLTTEELEFALDGRYVTRVIYLEDSESALPRQDDPKVQRHFDVLSNQDPLKVADQLGRPMAILRMGSRVPDAGGAMNACPPVYIYPPPPATGVGAPPADSASNTAAAIERSERDVPRVFFPRDATGQSSSAGAPQPR